MRRMAPCHSSHLQQRARPSGPPPPSVASLCARSSSVVTHAVVDKARQRARPCTARQLLVKGLATVLYKRVGQLECVDLHVGVAVREALDEGCDSITRTGGTCQLRCRGTARCRRLCARGSEGPLAGGSGWCARLRTGGGAVPPPPVAAAADQVPEPPHPHSILCRRVETHPAEASSVTLSHIWRLTSQSSDARFSSVALAEEGLVSGVLSLGAGAIPGSLFLF